MQGNSFGMGRNTANFQLVDPELTLQEMLGSGTGKELYGGCVGLIAKLDQNPSRHQEK